MLIYNSKKEFLGIDEQDLQALGYENLTDLRAESDDFANLFIKTPGYIHNFKHVHWIDFVSCVESGEEAKVIIYAKEKAYRATLNIKSAYLVDHPSEKSFLVNLQNLRALTTTESAKISADIAQRAIPTGTVGESEIFVDSLDSNIAVSNSNIDLEDPYESTSLEDINSTVIKDEYDDAPISIELEDEPIQINEIETINTPVITEEISIQEPEKVTNDSLDIDLEDDLIIPLNDDEDNLLVDDNIDMLDISIDDDDNNIDMLDISMDDDEDILVQVEKPKDEIIKQEDEDEYEYIEVEVDDEDDSDYVFDPQVASDELGLTMELIEEFLEDFITQADEFKPELYNALDAGDFDEVKKLSHMLKGVAANLRIEDAKDTLVIINTSNDIDEVSTNLDKFYRIMAKLAGKDIPKKKIIQKVKKNKTATIEKQNTDNLLMVEKEPEIVQEKIEIVAEESNDDLLLMDDNLLMVEEEPEIVQEKIEIVAEEPNDDLLLMDDDLLMVEQEPSKYDKSIVANQLGLDLESFNELLEDYKKEVLSLTQKIKLSINNQKSSSWKQQAELLKNMNENMRVDIFNNELNTLLQTDSTDIAEEAINKIINIIPTIGG